MKNYDVLIIGAGPGGIFSAYELNKLNPNLKIGVFEAGNELAKRHCPIDGVKIKSLGNFTITSTAYKKGCRTYYPCSANYSTSGIYKPMVIEIDSCKTLFILARLITTSNNPNGSYYVKINDKTVGNFTTSEGHGDYTWATPRLMYDATSPKVTVEIYPNISAVGGHVDLLALLIS